MKCYFMELSLIFAFKFPRYSAINPTNVQLPSLISNFNPTYTQTHTCTHTQVQSYLVSNIIDLYQDYAHLSLERMDLSHLHRLSGPILFSFTYVSLSLPDKQT